MKKNFYLNEPYLIAETAYTFEGSKEYLMEQTLELSQDIDAIKYHMLIDIDQYMVKEHPVYDLLKNWIISEDDWKDILSQAKKRDKDTVVLTDDVRSIEFCSENYELVDAIEVHAACVNDLSVLNGAIQFCNKFSKTLILGISGFEIQELFDIMEYVKSESVEDILLIYGFQNYPTDITQINLSKMEILRHILDCKIGYADHTEYSNPAKESVILSAFSLGATVQEIHYVREEGIEKTDYITGVNAERLSNIKKMLMNISNAIGKPDFRLNQGEKQYLNFRKVPMLTKDIKSGDKINKEDYEFKRIEKPTRQNKFNELQSIENKNSKVHISRNTELDINQFTKK